MRPGSTFSLPRRYCGTVARWLFPLCLLGQPNQVRATERETFVRFRWLRSVEASVCPEQADVQRLVQMRLGRDPFAANALRTIEASIDAKAGLWHVELSVRDADGPVEGRRVFNVRADSCTKVVEAVSLAVALAIDPNASFTIDPRVPGLSVPSQTNTNPSTQGDTDVHSAPTSNPETPVRYRYAQIFVPIETPCAPSRPTPVELSLRGISAAGLLPKIAPGFAMAGSVGYQNSHAVLGISYFAESSRNQQFAFGLTTLDLGYRHDIVRSNSMAASLSAEVHVGALHSVVTQLEPLHPGDRFFGAVSLGPRLVWRAWAPFFIEGGVSAWVAFARPEFSMAGTNLPVFESKLVSGVGYLGAGWVTN
jgi:hypothetical protein